MTNLRKKELADRICAAIQDKANSGPENYIDNIIKYNTDLYSDIHELNNIIAKEYVQWETDNNYMLTENGWRKIK